MEKRNLPSIKELREDITVKSDQNDLNIILNTEPVKEWIRDHPFARGVKYLPIERIEYLLTRIFLKWNVEVKSVQTIANSIVCVIRLHYQDVLSDQMLWQDGIGAAPIQTQKGAGAMEWDKTLNDAVMKAAPAAESYAVKDAAEKIGKLFGKDLNRADKIMYDTLIGQVTKDDKHKDLFDEPNTEKQ